MKDAPEILKWLRAENAWKAAELAKLRAVTGSFSEIGEFIKLAWYPDDPKFLYISTYTANRYDYDWEEERVEFGKVRDFLKLVESRPHFNAEMSNE